MITNCPKEAAGMSLSISSRQCNGWRIITLAGEVTPQCRQMLRDAFRASRSHPYVVVDITKVDFRAPADFEPLTFGRRLLSRAGGELRLVHPSDIVRRAVDALVYDAAFPVLRDLDAAVRSEPPTNCGSARP